MTDPEPDPIARAFRELMRKQVTEYYANATGTETKAPPPETEGMAEGLISLWGATRWSGMEHFDEVPFLVKLDAAKDLMAGRAIAIVNRPDGTSVFFSEPTGVSLPKLYANK